jgi:hypothetical protein
LTAHLKAQHSAEWLFYQPRSANEHLRPREFRIAMALRCRTLPTEIRNRITTYRCNCGTTTPTTEETIEHLYRCRHASLYTFTHRHTDVKYAIARVLREHGIQTTIEPTFYRYPDGQRRPDLTAHANPPAAIDIVICYQENQPGDRAAVHAQEKIRIHEAAVNAAQHNFFPFALETHGDVNEKAIKFIRHVSNNLQPHLHRHFERRMLQAVSSQLAKSRVQALLAMPQLAGVMFA